MPASDRVRTEVNPESPVGNHISNYSTNVLFNESSQNRDSAPIAPMLTSKALRFQLISSTRFEQESQNKSCRQEMIQAVNTSV